GTFGKKRFEDGPLFRIASSKCLVQYLWRRNLIPHRHHPQFGIKIAVCPSHVQTLRDDARFPQRIGELSIYQFARVFRRKCTEIDLTQKVDQGKAVVLRYALQLQRWRVLTFVTTVDN